MLSPNKAQSLVEEWHMEWLNSGKSGKGLAYRVGEGSWHRRSCGTRGIGIAGRGLGAGEVMGTDLTKRPWGRQGSGPP